MRKSTILFAAMFSLLFVAHASYAVNDSSFPRTLVDSACTDTEDTVGVFVFRNAFVQTTGSSDGLCDHDLRIVKGPLTEDTVFSTMARIPGQHGIVVFADADTVSNDTDTWSVRLRAYRPHEPAVAFNLCSADAIATEGNKLLGFGPPLYVNPVFTSVTMCDTPATGAALPKYWHLMLDLGTATSWGGNISWVPY